MSTASTIKTSMWMVLEDTITFLLRWSTMVSRSNVFESFHHVPYTHSSTIWHWCETHQMDFLQTLWWCCATYHQKLATGQHGFGGGTLHCIIPWTSKCKRQSHSYRHTYMLPAVHAAGQRLHMTQWLNIWWGKRFHGPARQDIIDGVNRQELHASSYTANPPGYCS